MLKLARFRDLRSRQNLAGIYLISGESSIWEETLQSPVYRNMQRSAPPTLGGTIYIGLTAGLPLEEIGAIQLYTGPDLQTSRMLNWVDWQAIASRKRNPTFKPGNYHHRLEIFKHLDIVFWQLPTKM
jgi:hypothetical protein